MADVPVGLTSCPRTWPSRTARGTATTNRRGDTSAGRPTRSGGVGLRAAHELSERLASPPGGSSPSGGYETSRNVVIHITWHLLMAPAEAAAAFDKWLAAGALTGHPEAACAWRPQSRRTASRLRAVPGRLAGPLHGLPPRRAGAGPVGAVAARADAAPRAALRLDGRAAPPHPLLRRRPRHDGPHRPRPDPWPATTGGPRTMAGRARARRLRASQSRQPDPRALRDGDSGARRGGSRGRRPRPLRRGAGAGHVGGGAPGVPHR